MFAFKTKINSVKKTSQTNNPDDIPKARIKLQRLAKCA